MLIVRSSAKLVVLNLAAPVGPNPIYHLYACLISDQCDLPALIEGHLTLSEGDHTGNDLFRPLTHLFALQTDTLGCI